MVDYLLSHFTYFGIIALLVSAGIGMPFPEDVTLLTGGYLVHRGYTSLSLTLLAAYFGVVVGDLLVFRIGRRLGPGIYSHPRLGKFFTPKRRVWIQQHFSRRGILTVVIGRHAAGLRVPTFLVAGASGMRTRTFFLADALSALSTVPLVVSLGYWFGDSLDAVRKGLHHAQLWILAAVVFGLVGVLYVRHRRQSAIPGPGAGSTKGAPISEAPK